MARFHGKTVVVTGGTSGIGLATGRRIAAEGGRVMLTGRSQAYRRTAATAVPEAVVLQNDSSNPEDAHGLAAAVSERFESLDTLFLNAGFEDLPSIGPVMADGIDRLFAIMVRGPALQLAALRPMLGGGSAVLLTSSLAPLSGRCRRRSKR